MGENAAGEGERVKHEKEEMEGEKEEESKAGLCFQHTHFINILF